MSLNGVLTQLMEQNLHTRSPFMGHSFLFQKEKTILGIVDIPALDERYIDLITLLLKFVEAKN